MRQYEVFELTYRGAAPEGSQAAADVSAVFCQDGTETRVKGFYAGGEIYKIRYYPRRPGKVTWRVESAVPLEGELSGTDECAAQSCRKESIQNHGMVRADGLHFRYEDGSRYLPFGTTVYALVHQEDTLIDRTMDTLKNAPFNKLRFCVFPKHYDFNHNEPEFFPFEKSNGKWDVHRPCFAYWERLERRILQLKELGIECDLILFHGYDRWGFSKLSREECLVYLDYLLRRLSAYPNLWWSLANEYEVLVNFKKEWWYEFTRFIRANDPNGHLLSNHNFLEFWDFKDPGITHCSIQDSGVIHVPELQREYRKPVIFDECCYEGNIIHPWGNLSGFELVHRFWTACVMGGYCTHGETFMSEDEVLWWSKGGELKGESPARIRFLRELLEELPGPLEYQESPWETVLYGGQESSEEENADPVIRMVTEELRAVSQERRQAHLDKERIVMGHCGQEAYIRYFRRQCPAEGELILPPDGFYDVEVIDIWEMTRKPALHKVQGRVLVPMPGKEGIALLARKTGRPACPKNV